MDNNCKYCNGNEANLFELQIIHEDRTETLDLYISVNEENYPALVMYSRDRDYEGDFDVHYKPIDYCPICGRNLIKEEQTMTIKEAIDRIDMVIDIFPEDDEAVETLEKIKDAIKNGFKDGD